MTTYIAVSSEETSGKFVQQMKSIENAYKATTQPFGGVVDLFDNLIKKTSLPFLLA